MKTGLIVISAMIVAYVWVTIVSDVYTLVLKPRWRKRKERIEQGRYWAGYVYVRSAVRKGRTLKELDAEAHQDFPFYTSFERGMFDALGECESDRKLREQLAAALEAVRAL